MNADKGNSRAEGAQESLSASICVHLRFYFLV